VAAIGLEHLGQLEFAEQGEIFKPTGLARSRKTNDVA
jgi:hypothetical protein